MIYDVLLTRNSFTGVSSTSYIIHHTSYIIYHTSLKRMALIDMVMPKMGESIMECTVITWLKQVGERFEADESSWRWLRTRWIPKCPHPMPVC